MFFIVFIADFSFIIAKYDIERNYSLCRRLFFSQNSMFMCTQTNFSNYVKTKSNNDAKEIPFLFLPFILSEWEYEYYPQTGVI